MPWGPGGSVSKLRIVDPNLILDRRASGPSGGTRRWRARPPRLATHLVMAAAETIVSIDRVEKRFGAVRAVEEVSSIYAEGSSYLCWAERLRQVDDFAHDRRLRGPD